MPNCIVKMPNGNYGIWSTIVDSFHHLDLTKEQVLEAWLKHETFKDGEPLSPKRENEIKDSISDMFINIENIGRACDWSPKWNDCLFNLNSFDQFKCLDRIRKLGQCEEIVNNVTHLQEETYWHLYWRTRYIGITTQLISALGGANIK